MKTSLKLRCRPGRARQRRSRLSTTTSPGTSARSHCRRPAGEHVGLAAELREHPARSRPRIGARGLDLAGDHHVTGHRRRPRLGEHARPARRTARSPCAITRSSWADVSVGKTRSAGALAVIREPLRRDDWLLSMLATIVRRRGAWGHHHAPESFVASLTRLPAPTAIESSGVGQGQLEGGHLLGVAHEQHVADQRRMVPGLALDGGRPRDLG